MNIETANKLLRYRKMHSLSQEQLAEKIGVSRQAVSKWERAEASPDTDNLILLAKIYGITIDELITGSEKANNDDISASAGNTDDAGKQSSGNGAYISTGISSGGSRLSADKGDMPLDENVGQEVHADESVHTSNGDKLSRKRGNKKSLWYSLPYPIFALIIFLLWGFFGFAGGFYRAWLIFLTVPLYYTLAEAIIKRKPSKFCYPVLAVIFFFVWGFWGGSVGGFSISWIFFLTIPIYYCICSALEGNAK